MTDHINSSMNETPVFLVFLEDMFNNNLYKIYKRNTQYTNTCIYK